MKRETPIIKALRDLESRLTHEFFAAVTVGDTRLITKLCGSVAAARMARHEVERVENEQHEEAIAHAKTLDEFTQKGMGEDG